MRSLLSDTPVLATFAFYCGSCFATGIECCPAHVSQVESPDPIGLVAILTVECRRVCRGGSSTDRALLPSPFALMSLGQEWEKEATP